MRSLFIFHRDLSIEDNLGLHECIQASKVVHCIFIFTPAQADPTKNKYFGQNSFSFMLNSLAELSKKIKISFFRGESAVVLKKIIHGFELDAIWENKDFSPFAEARQKQHAKICKTADIKYFLWDSITLRPMGDFVNTRPYIKFTPFYEYARHKPIPRPLGSVTLSKVSRASISGSLSLFVSSGQIRPNHVFGGRKQALALLKAFIKKAPKYAQTRDFPNADMTSHLGPHLRFGTISPREVYHKVGSRIFRKQLYWREFYLYLAHYWVKTYEKKSWTLPKFNKIVWGPMHALKQWQEGRTGAPIVDAAMRELRVRGTMHNRLRMLCAMYLVHYLHIHWKHGERWFAQNLIDYSYENNYGGWVWCAGFEVHSNPYFRIFSLIRQHKKYDPDNKYTLKWCPELKNMDILAQYKGLGLEAIREKTIKYYQNL